MDSHFDSNSEMPRVKHWARLKHSRSGTQRVLLTVMPIRFVMDWPKVMNSENETVKAIHSDLNSVKHSDSDLETRYQ